MLEGETKDSDAVAGAAIARIVVMTGDSKRSLLLPRVGTDTGAIGVRCPVGVVVQQAGAGVETGLATQHLQAAARLSDTAVIWQPPAGVPCSTIATPTRVAQIAIRTCRTVFTSVQN